MPVEDVTLPDTGRSDDGSLLINPTLGGPTPPLDILSQLKDVEEASSKDGDGMDRGQSSCSGDGPPTRIIVKFECVRVTRRMSLQTPRFFGPRTIRYLAGSERAYPNPRPVHSASASSVS